MLFTRATSPVFASLEVNGHELGTHAHPNIQMGPLNGSMWGNRPIAMERPFITAALTQQIWSDNKRWADSLATVNVAMCAMPFLCSDEGQLTSQFGFTSDPGDRSEKGLDYFGHLVRHPFRRPPMIGWGMNWKRIGRPLRLS